MDTNQQLFLYFKFAKKNLNTPKKIIITREINNLEKVAEHVN